MCYRAIAQWKTKGDGHCAMYVESECEETFSRRSAKFTGPLVSLGAVTLTMVNAISLGKLSRGASHLSFSIPR